MLTNTHKATKKADLEKKKGFSEVITTLERGVACLRAFAKQPSVTADVEKSYLEFIAVGGSVPGHMETMLLLNRTEKQFLEKNRMESPLRSSRISGQMRRVEIDDKTEGQDIECCKFFMGLDTADFESLLVSDFQLLMASWKDAESFEPEKACDAVKEAAQPQKIENGKRATQSCLSQWSLSRVGEQVLKEVHACFEQMEKRILQAKQKSEAKEKIIAIAMDDSAETRETVKTKVTGLKALLLVVASDVKKHPGP